MEEQLNPTYELVIWCTLCKDDPDGCFGDKPNGEWIIGGYPDWILALADVDLLIEKDDCWKWSIREEQV